ncbi:DUF3566 domain-containing protein [Kribbella sp. VKM Ac-2568]|uniref:DUF3566 domain-containing protein n=1 Tax=Kribbella sp. VKM Ac-2568 TaxID=2512219 RepID=UPI0010517772|nr:DUF3566 domain-containing protein [Kribbella sp. VKM Ac-2568]TCM45732.1 transmembrane protein DUF3566 [Kribbella sp. VKM Ac-2568]
MTNRARPTWPDGADSGKSERPSQGGNGKSRSTPTATPTSNGRTTPSANGKSSANGNGTPGNGQPRPSTPNGQSGEIRQQPRPGAPANQPGQASEAKPSRPPQQPSVRPVVKQNPPVVPPSSHGSSQAPSGQRPPLATPSTPGRPEPRFPAPAGQPGGGQPATPSYGQTGKASTGESFGDRVNAAKQAVMDKAGALKEAATSGADTKARNGTESKPNRFGIKTDAKAEAPGVGTGAAVAAKSTTGTRTTTSPSVKTSTRHQTRKARLRLSRLDPWSVMKTSFLLSIAFGIVVWVAVFIVWSAIGAAGVFDNINNTVTEVLGTPAAEPFRIENYINTGKVMGFTTLLACADVLIITALATLGSFLYNIAATLLGGLEVTLASED